MAELIASQLRPVPGIASRARRPGRSRPALLHGVLQPAPADFSLALRTTGLTERFAGRWWGADDVAAGKPAPDLFLLAAWSMGAQPADCVVVEDSAAGVQAGCAAGMSVLGFAARTPPGFLRRADHIFTDMAQLPALLLGAASTPAQVVGDQGGEVGGHPVRARAPRGDRRPGSPPIGPGRSWAPTALGKKPVGIRPVADHDAQLAEAALHQSGHRFVRFAGDLGRAAGGRGHERHQCPGAGQEPVSAPGGEGGIGVGGYEPGSPRTAVAAAASAP